MIDEWNIDKGKKACSRCAVPFGSEETYMSGLFEVGETFERRNFCGTCWSAGVEGVFSYWKTQAAKKEQKVDHRQTLADLFESMLESAEPEGNRLKMAFLVAMSLVRKRVLKMQPPVYRDGREFLVFDRAGDHRQFTLPQPDIREEEIAGLTDELAGLLGMEI